MLVLISDAFFLASLLGLLVVLVEHASVVRHMREVAPRPKGRPGISILKPLCGIDDDLEANLAVFVALDYPNYELLLGVRSVEDGAYPIACAVAQRWPRIARVIVQRGEPGLNAKVNQLLTLEADARHEIVLVSDSNVQVDPGYLWEIAAHLEDPEIALVTHPIVGMGEQRIGSLFDRLHLASLVSPGMIAGKRIMNQDFVVGKSMAMRRADLRALGGFESVKDILAEDYLLGRRISTVLGKQVRVGHMPVINVSHQQGLMDFCLRYARWNIIQRSFVGRVVFGSQILLNPFLLALVAALARPSGPRFGLLVAIAGVKSLGDALSRRVQEGRALQLAHVLVTPAKDLAVGFSWGYAMLRSTVTWRGKKLRVLQGTQIAPDVKPRESELH